MPFPTGPLADVKFRWMENGRLKSMLVGSIAKLPTRSHAERAVEHFRIRINADNPQQQFHSVTVGAVIDRYLKEEMPMRVRKDTASTYCGILENWIRPNWVRSLSRMSKRSQSNTG